MPRSSKTSWLLPLFESPNPVRDLMAEGHNLIEAEKLAGMSWDEAAEKANACAVAKLVEWLESQTEGEKAVMGFWSQLQRKGCRVDNGEWKKEGVALKTPEAHARFKLEARFYDAFDHLSNLRRFLNGEVPLQGTWGEFRLLALRAFEAGAHYAEAEGKLRTGRKAKLTRHKELLLGRLRDAERAIQHDTNRPRAQISAKEIFDRLQPPARTERGSSYRANSLATLVSKMRQRWPE